MKNIKVRLDYIDIMMQGCINCRRLMLWISAVIILLLFNMLYMTVNRGINQVQDRDSHVVQTRHISMNNVTGLHYTPWKSFYDVSQVHAKFDRYIRELQISCAHVTRLGSGDVPVCDTEPYRPSQTDCVTYVFGLSRDLTFEQKLMHNYNCIVRLHDRNKGTWFSLSRAELDQAEKKRILYYKTSLFTTESRADRHKLPTLNNLLTANKEKQTPIDLLRLNTGEHTLQILSTSLAEGSLSNVKQLSFTLQQPSQASIARLYTATGKLNLQQPSQAFIARLYTAAGKLDADRARIQTYEHVFSVLQKLEEFGFRKYSVEVRNNSTQLDFYQEGDFWIQLSYVNTNRG